MMCFSRVCRQGAGCVCGCGETDGTGCAAEAGLQSTGTVGH